jgi:hypothetical protein
MSNFFPMLVVLTVLGSSTRVSPIDTLRGKLKMSTARTFTSSPKAAPAWLPKVSKTGSVSGSASPPICKQNSSQKLPLARQHLEPPHLKANVSRDQFKSKRRSTRGSSSYSVSFDPAIGIMQLPEIRNESEESSKSSISPTKLSRYVESQRRAAGQLSKTESTAKLPTKSSKSQILNFPKFQSKKTLLGDEKKEIKKKSVKRRKIMKLLKIKDDEEPSDEASESHSKNSQAERPKLAREISKESQRIHVLRNLLAETISSLSAPFQLLLKGPMLDGFRWEDDGQPLFIEVRAELVNADEDTRNLLQEVFKLAFLRFSSVLNHIMKGHRMNPEMGILKPELYEKIEGGMRLTYYLWPFCEYLKFKSSLANMGITLKNIHKFNFLNLSDEEDVKKQREEKELAELGQEPQNSNKYFFNASYRFLDLLKGLYRVYPQTYFIIRKYATFWVEFSQYQEEMAKEHIKIFHIIPESPKNETPTSPINIFAPKANENSIINRDGFRYLINILKENFTIISPHP